MLQLHGRWRRMSYCEIILRNIFLINSFVEQVLVERYQSNTQFPRSRLTAKIFVKYDADSLNQSIRIFVISLIDGSI